MDDPRPPVTPDPSRPGRLSREEARALLAGGDSALASGDFEDAARHFGRVVGFDDPGITGAALLGLGEARYRLGEDEAALTSWQAVLRLGETPSTYAAWRNLAAARVRAGDLLGAIDAYRQADRRAPAEDKAEIANRLGWLTKETGDPGAARRYFARGRGDGPLLSVTTVLIAASVIVSLTALLSDEGSFLFDAFQLDKGAVATGEYWRLLTVTLLHGSLLHLAFNMYALYLAGPIVERWYGSTRFLLIYLACAAAGSVGSFVFGGDAPSVGASGAIFGLFGVLLAASRLHHPVDRQSRMLVSQLGMLILINIAFGFAVRGIDNAAHLAGLAAGLWLGAVLPPTRVQTLASMWQRVTEARVAHMARLPAFVPVVALGVVLIAVVAGLLFGTPDRLE
jgi:membrane associated rhomboid family serine protease